MYSERIVSLTLDGFEKENKWRPQPRTPEQVDDFTGYIESLVDMEANSVNRYFNWREGKKPSKLEIEWIQQQIRSEQFLCFASAEYFSTRYGRIRTVDERIIRIQFRKAQQIFHALLAEYDDLQIAIQFFILKARQV